MAQEVVLGVSGGIAAYRSCDIVRGLQRRGAEVTVVMTAHAREFIAPLTLATLSGRPVITSHFEAREEASGDVEHIQLARRCDLLLVAPATANVIAKMAAGLADDFLSTFYLVVTSPVLVAPSMNTAMWRHVTVSENVDRLRERGVRFIDPEVGPLASRGEGIGEGRLAHPDRIVEAAMEILATGRARGPLSGRTVLVTAGPTREAIDPVRFLSNRSSGRMGYAVAEAARDLGAEVVLVSGPTDLPDPSGVRTVRVVTADQMKQAVMDHLPGASVIVKAAAVADYRPSRVSPGKIKKSGKSMTLTLDPTEDILEAIGKAKGDRFVIGFAAETGDPIAAARRKLLAKNLDLIVANDVSESNGAGVFGSGDNEVVVLDPGGGEERWPRMAKTEIAARLMALVAKRLP